MVRIDFINVGYGDAVLLRFFSEDNEVYRILVDCGDRNTGSLTRPTRRISAADYLMKMGIGSLDLVVISHLHLDHTGGLSRVVESVKIRELWTNYLPPGEYWGKRSDENVFRDKGAAGLVKALNAISYSADLLEKKGCRIRCMKDSCRLSIPGLSGSVLEMTVPDRELLERQKVIFDQVCKGQPDEENLHSLDLFINNTSLRIVVISEGKKISLPGDTYGIYWEHCGYQPCDLLKIPHHGHSDGITEKMLMEMRPEEAVISVSDDRTDDCPSRDLLVLLKRLNIPVSFTDAVKLPDTEPDLHEAVRYMVSRDGIERSYVTF